MNCHEHLLYETAPAVEFTEAYPIGNGKLGGMVYGEPSRLRLGLNHDELWAGHNSDESLEYYDKKDYLEARRLALEGKYFEAELLLDGKLGISDSAAYVTLGNFFVDLKLGEVTEYRRELDLRNSVARVSFLNDNSPVLVEYIASYPRNVIAMRMTSEKPLDLVASAALEMIKETSVSENRVSYFGECPTLCARQLDRSKLNYTAKYHKGIEFCSAFDVLTDGDMKIADCKFLISGAKSTVVYFSAETSYLNGHEYGKDDYRERVGACLDKAVKVGFDEIYAEHLKDVNELYDRVKLSFSSNSPTEKLPTRERIRAYSENSGDNALVTLAFNFGRYLMIAGSRPGSRPTTLQGIWNDSMTPPWSSNYTVNINTEMNYWPTLPCDMTELLEPLESHLRLIEKTGAKVAKQLYGANGFTANHNMDIFGYAKPAFGWPGWSFFPVSAAWLLRELFNKYEYTLDKGYLESIWSLLSGSAEFFLDVLVDDGDYLILSPGASAENRYVIDNGADCAIAKSSTVFASIVRETLTNFVKAADVLGKSDGLVERAKMAIPRLLPLRITKDGRIEEWYFGKEAPDIEEPDIRHRHLSHLYSLYPGNEITPGAPELFSAAKKSLAVRGDDAQGWSMGWKINCYARLCDSEGVMRLVNMFLRPIEPNAENNGHGGIYPNLFCAHPPFQIDGNFGFVAGICEALVGYENGEPKFLQALPAELNTGSVSGLAIKGGKRVNLEWKDGKLTKSEIY